MLQERTKADPMVADKIQHILTIYPKVSPSMLQICLQMPAKDWKPILEALITSNRISRQTIVSPTPTGRHQTYTVLSLTE